MADPFDEGSRSLQERFGTTALADRIDSVLVRDTISTDDRAFLEARDMSFLATADGAGRPTCSYKGGEPGFVRVLDERTVAFPSYDGNGMCLSAGNVLVNPEVGMLFPGLRTWRHFSCGSGVVFDLVSQDEVGAGVAGVGGSQVLTEFSDGGGGSPGW